MYVTFLIGNGFDINCGLKCTYPDIYKGYINSHDNDTEAIQLFKNDILKKPRTWADFEVAMNEYLPRFKSESEFLHTIRDFKSYMLKHLKTEEDLFMSRLLNLENGWDNNIVKEISRSFKHFFDGNTRNVRREMEEKARTVLHFSFICFNYTTVVDTIISKYLASPDVIHIHGLLEDGAVLGMDNEAQLKKDIPFVMSNKSRREFIKPYFNQFYDNQKVNDALKSIDESDVICVFGLSLGESDISWRNRILDWLKIDGHNLFLYDYKYSNLKETDTHARLDYEEEAKGEFLERFRVSNNVTEETVERVHIPIGYNLFNISNMLEEAEHEKADALERSRLLQEKLKGRSTGSMQGA